MFQMLLECAKEVGKCLWPPIKRHIDYWWSFEDNIQGLTDETDCLERERIHMDQKIEQARIRADYVNPEVGDWLNKCTQNLEEAIRTLQSGDEPRPVNIISRCLMGKSAKKTAEEIGELRTKGRSITISYPAPPPAAGPIRHEASMQFESRRRIEENIMKCLKDEHVRTVAICGGGGVGKTTMARRIEDRVRKENLFDEIVHVVVSQQPEMLKIQKEIADLLGLGLTEDTSLAVRSHKLHTRLVDSKRKLIVFDDVWNRFSLTDLGVPLENDFGRCKIILTSRIKDACKRMNAQKIIEMDVLTKEEAWALFKEKAGSYVEGPDFRSIAEDVAEECKCLPLALVIVGEALKDQSIPVWIDSLTQLRKAVPTDEVLEDVYKPLKLSYDFLGDESVKSLFLICCLFPEDYKIPVELLTLYSIGLGMFEGIRNIEEGRIRARSFLEMLKNRFLLIDAGDDDVRMHDVVRDVAIFIGSKEKQGYLKSLEVSTMRPSIKDSSHNCNWMSIDFSIEDAKPPVGSDFPNLRLLILHNFHPYGRRSSQVFDSNVISFEGMEELNVLSISFIDLPSLPPTLATLNKLTTLRLEYSSVEDISVVGKLKSLEILSIYNCHSIEELPADIRRLNQLRILELYSCVRLKRVAAGVISSLVGLEELKIIDCFDKWEAEGNQSEERNSCLSELSSLHRLTCLNIEISDHDLIAQEIRLSQKLVRYNVDCLGTRIRYYRNSERHMALTLREGITVGNWIHQLVRSTQSLFLRGDGSNNFNLHDIKRLARLSLWNCSTIKKLVNAIDCKFPVLQELEIRRCGRIEQVFWNEIESNTDASTLVFPKLKILSLVELPKLERLTLGELPNLAALSQGYEIIESPQLEWLRIQGCPKLRLKIGKCPNLRYVDVSAFNDVDYLLSSCCTREWNTRLRSLGISKHDTIEEILWDEIEDEGNRHIVFPHLFRLTLRDLPCLTTFYRGVESIKFPNLHTMEIENLPRLNGLLPMDSEASHDHHSLRFFCNQKVEIPHLDQLCIKNLHDAISKIWCDHVPNNSYHNLRSLTICDVKGIRNLMSSLLAQNFMNLEHLTIVGCQEMVAVMEDDIEVFVTSLFPKLETLEITELQKLRSFCQWKHSFELSSLRRVRIDDCPCMRIFSLGSPSSPHLFDFTINGEDVGMKGLNDGIRDRFMKKSQEGDSSKNEEQTEYMTNIDED